MSEISGENPRHKAAPKDRLPTKAKIALAATAAMAAVGAAFGVYKLEQGGNKGDNRIEPVASINLGEIKDSLLNKVDEAFAGRNIGKPEGEKYPEENKDLRFGQLVPIDHDLYRNAEGVRKMVEDCRTDGKPVTYAGEEYAIDKDFRDYRATILFNCEGAATALKWAFMQTGDVRFKDGLRKMFEVHEAAFGVVKLDIPDDRTEYFSYILKNIYKPVLGADFAPMYIEIE